jgi:hypothetical protein
MRWGVEAGFDDDDDDEWAQLPEEQKATRRKEWDDKWPTEVLGIKEPSWFQSGKRKVVTYADYKKITFPDFGIEADPFPFVKLVEVDFDVRLFISLTN